MTKETRTTLTQSSIDAIKPPEGTEVKRYFIVMKDGNREFKIRLLDNDTLAIEGDIPPQEALILFGNYCSRRDVLLKELQERATKMNKLAKIFYYAAAFGLIMAVVMLVLQID